MGAAPPASRAVATDEQRVALVRSSITGFVQRNPDALDAFPSSAAQTGGAWPSRRTWSMLAAVLPHLREDDNAAINTAVFGLIGEGAGVEFLEWRRSADLPDPVAVVENPDSAFDWQSRPDLVWAVLSGVTAWAVGTGHGGGLAQCVGSADRGCGGGRTGRGGRGGAHAGEGATGEGDCPGVCSSVRADVDRCGSDGGGSMSGVRVARAG